MSNNVVAAQKKMDTRFWVPIMVMALISVSSFIFGVTASRSETALRPRLDQVEIAVVGLKQVDSFRNAQILGMQDAIIDIKLDVKEILRRLPQ